MARKPAEFVNHPMDFPSDLAFRGFCTNIVDGDTFDALIDIGLNKYAYEALRLKDIDTPEIFRPKSEEEREAGQKAKTFVESLILNKPIKLVTYKDKTTFGRYVADVLYYQNGEWYDLAQSLRDQGYEKHLWQEPTC